MVTPLCVGLRRCFCFHLGYLFFLLCYHFSECGFAFFSCFIMLLENGLNFITANSKKKRKKLSDRRIEMPDYPERSYLEGLVNAPIHRSYTELGGEVHIDMFDDRLEIYSQGGM